METIIFGAGCFWGVEEKFRRLPGVIETEAGYAGGTTEHPTYEQVCSGTTGHAEAVRVQFDPDQISLSVLLRKFWKIHNPSGAHRLSEGAATYSYRSVIFYTAPEQRDEIQRYKEDLENSGRYPNGIHTQIIPAESFFRAEERHQKYHAKRRQS